MKIMIMAQCYAPEEISGAVLITELAEDLVKYGHNVSIVTGAPSYPIGQVFNGYKNSLHAVETLNGVRVIRTWSYISPSKSMLSRLLHYGTYCFTAFWGALFEKRPDVIVSFSPPLPLGISAWLLSCKFRIPWLLVVEDLFPDAIVAAGVKINRIILNFFYAIENFIYKRSSRICVITQNFQETLVKKKVPSSKIHIIPVWADPNEVIPMPKDNNFRRRHGLEDKFVVMYSGNIGFTSCLEDVLDAACLLKDENDIKFVIIGEGVKKEALVAEKLTKKIDNLIFLPYEPRALFPEMLAAADIGLVTLNDGSALSSMPVKTFNIMASARPILAVTPTGSEVSKVVERAHCGRNVPTKSPELVARSLLELQGDEPHLSQMGQNGRNYLEKEFSRSQCVDSFEKLLTRLGDH